MQTALDYMQGANSVFLHRSVLAYPFENEAVFPSWGRGYQAGSDDLRIVPLLSIDCHLVDITTE